MSQEIPLKYETNFDVVGLEDLLSTALGKMKKAGVNSLVVIDGIKYAGIVTERAIARSMLDPAKTKVKTVYQRVPALEPSATLHKAAKLMVGYDTRILPVLKDGTLLGVVRDTMLLEEAMAGEYGRIKVRQVMTTNIIMVQRQDSIGKALSLMRKNGITRLPVMDGPRVVGIVTIHDILTNVVKPKVRMGKGEVSGEKRRYLSDPVHTIMSTPVISVHPETQLRDAFRLMESNQISSLLVVNEFDELVGIVTRHDLLRPLSEVQSQEEDVRVQISVKMPGGTDEIDVKRLRSEIESFKRRYLKLLKNSTLSVYIKAHREKKRGRRLIHARVVLNGPSGSFSAVGEGWGDVQAINEVLAALEKQIAKEKEVAKKRNEGRKGIYDAISLLY